MRLELRAHRGRLELLEAVDEPKRLRVEERELLLDGDCEILAVLEALPRLRNQLFIGNAL